jgi:hypothetical protein
MKNVNISLHISLLYPLLLLRNFDHSLSNSSLPIVHHLGRLFQRLDIVEIHCRPNDRLDFSLLDILAQEIQIRADGIEEHEAVIHAPSGSAPLPVTVYEVKDDPDEGGHGRFGRHAHDAGVLELFTRGRGGDGDDRAGLGA